MDAKSAPSVDRRDAAYQKYREWEPDYSIPKARKYPNSPLLSVLFFPKNRVLSILRASFLNFLQRCQVYLFWLGLSTPYFFSAAATPDTYAPSTTL